MENNVLVDYKITERETVYDGYVKMEKVTITKGDKEIKREILKMGNSVSAIIKDTVKNKYIFVSQYRVGAEGLMVEIVAGKIDAGEKPEEAIKREIMEETGYKVDYMDHLKDFYTSPGRTDEIMTVFYVEVSEKVNDGGGIGDEEIGIVEVEMLGLGGRLFFEDPLKTEIKLGEENNFKAPYQIIDAKTLVAVMAMENSNVLKGMADVITQAKLRSL
jgi:nudix-type nucleoside diphosphatase (YffH/AdpP family)